MKPEPIPDAIYDELANNAVERLAQVFVDALQLIEHPKQRAILAEAIAAGMMRSAARVVKRAYHDDTGRHITMTNAIRAVIASSYKMAMQDVADD